MQFLQYPNQLQVSEIADDKLCTYQVFYFTQVSILSVLATEIEIFVSFCCFCKITSLNWLKYEVIESRWNYENSIFM